MTAVWDKNGNRLPVTILQVSRAQVISVKTLAKHGYYAVQVGIGSRSPRNVTKAMLGHFAAAEVAPKMHVGEFRVQDESCLLPVGKSWACTTYLISPGSEIKVTHFSEGQYVDVQGKGLVHFPGTFDNVL
jgi:large subunit ribosomal protein L3